MDEKSELETKIQEKGKELFAETTKEIFAKHGDIVDTFGWCQYTPYFNDGEPCEFRKYELFIWSKEDKESEDFEDNYYEMAGTFSSYGTDNNKLEPYLYKYQYEYQPYSYGKEPKKPVEIMDALQTYEPYRNTKVVGEVEKLDNPNYDPTYGEAYGDISGLYKMLDETTLKHLFGDHCVVLVTADGVEVEEHEHE